MVALRKISPDPMTVGEFLEWDGGKNRRWELRDGVPIAMAPSTRDHGALQSELAFLITQHLRSSNAPCSVITEPGIVPRVRARINARIPDLAITCSPPRPEQLVSDPILLIEILSPSNAKDTWDNVWSYASIPSVREILVIASTEIAAHLLRRLPDGTWPENPELMTASDRLRFDSIDLSFPLRDAYRTTSLV